jgi:hypothetical protein
MAGKPGSIIMVELDPGQMKTKIVPDYEAVVL